MELKVWGFRKRNFCNNFFRTYLAIVTLLHPPTSKLTTFATAKLFKKLQDLDSAFGNIIQNVICHFPGCDLVYLQDSFYFRSFDFAHLSRMSSGAYHLESNINITFERHSDIHRHTRSHCSLGILSFQEYSQETEDWILARLIPRHAPILRKDEDHFVFIASNEQVSNQVLLSPRFGSRVKFKVSITNDGSNITCKSVDLYAGLYGHEQLKTFKKLPGQGDTLEEIFPDMTTNFNGKVFRFSIPKVAFGFEIRLGPDNKYHPVRGFYKWYFDEVMRKFNFSYDMFYSSFGGGTGKKFENGTWVGALADVLYGRADFSTMVGLVYSRHKYIGWSSALSYEWMVFMTPTPKKSYSPKAIFWSFTPIMWLLFFVSLVIVTISLKVVGSLRFDPNPRGINLNILSAFTYVYSTFLEQDINLSVKTSSVRILASFWLLFAMVTATAYRGKLVSLIAFPVNTWIPVTFEELANSHFKVALNLVGKAGAAYTWVVSSPNPIIRKLAERVEYIHEGVNCLERAIKEDLGCILWKGVSDYVVVKNLTDRYGNVPLEESEGTAMFIHDGWNFEKRAIFGHTFDRTIEAAVQMGLSLKWFKMDQNFVKNERKEWNLRRNISQVSYMEDEIAKPLVTSQFSGLFWIFVVSVFVAWVQLILELLLNSWMSFLGKNSVN